MFVRESTIGLIFKISLQEDSVTLPGHATPEVWDPQPDTLTPAVPIRPCRKARDPIPDVSPGAGAPEEYSGETVRPADGRIAKMREIGHAKRSDQVPILPRRSLVHGLPALSGTDKLITQPWSIRPQIAFHAVAQFQDENARDRKNR